MMIEFARKFACKHNSFFPPHLDSEAKNPVPSFATVLRLTVDSMAVLVSCASRRWHWEESTHDDGCTYRKTHLHTVDSDADD